MVLLESLDLPMGSSAIDFQLKNVDGEIYSLANFAEAKILVIVFMCNHCPYVQAIWQRLIDFQQEFQNQGVQLVGINPNLNPNYPDETFEKIQEYYQRYQMNFPYLQDDTQEVAKAYQAQCTPDIYVYNEERELVYHGRLDDNWREQEKVQRCDLKEYVEALIAGKILQDKQYPSMGCSIKWRE